MKKELEIKLLEQLRRRMMKLPSFVVDYLYVIENAKEIQTRIEYAKDYLLFFTFLKESEKIKKEKITEIEINDIKELTDRDCIDFLDYLTCYTKTYQSTKGKSITQTYTNNVMGKSRKLAALHSLFAYLERTEKIEKDITKHLDIKIPTKVRIHDRLSEEEMTRLINTIREDSGLYSEHEKKYQQKNKERDYVIVLLLAYTGVRVSELVQLNIEDIKIEKQVMVITRKGGNEQEIPLPEWLTTILHTYIKKRVKEKAKDKALFLSLQKKRIHPKTIRLLLKKYQQRSNIETNLTPHVFRRTFGTNHYNQFQDMYLTAQILGHDSAETTRKFYADPSDERVKKSMESFRYKK